MTVLLTLQVIAAMRGCKISGSALCWVEEEGLFLPVPQTCTADLSEALVHRLLSQLAESGNTAVRYCLSLQAISNAVPTAPWRICHCMLSLKRAQTMRKRVGEGEGGGHAGDSSKNPQVHCLF